MSLVQYSSSDESDTDTPVADSKEPKAATATSKDSIASFLPPPKNRTVSIPKARILGGGAGAMPQRLETVALERGDTSVTSFVPTALRGKMKNKAPLFQEIKRSKRPSETKEGGMVLVHPSIEQRQPVELVRKRSLEPEIKEFNVNDFYDTNMELKAQGLLEENKMMHRVSNGKNQLSALMKNAQQDEELLKEKFERSKKLRKEKGERFGW